MFTMETEDKSSIEQKKIQLIRIITQLEDAELLEAVENLLIPREEVWWQSISNTEKQAIDKGLEDAANGRLKSHNHVMEEIEKRSIK